MNKKNEGRTPVYDNGFKIAIAREYLTGDLGYAALARKYNLGGPGVTKWFVKWYKQNYPEALCEQVVAKQPITGDPVKKDHLYGQLKQANLKIAGLEMLIETARKELGIDIVKKRGTKQS